jgi:hypothetical protein
MIYYLIFLFLKISSWFVWDSALRKYAIFNAFDHCKSDSVLLAGSYDEFFVITDKGGGNFIGTLMSSHNIPRM